ncbi:ankyrin repeat domain-containing protein 13C-like [Corticium candelabrum]|uniref:ankyrin repeat domain-containing protein 13C-like n=1 Tax=Corticium candelabrum TaxID=121492 RepID=UPI002E268539|nr:ankyrin repeat domain-containing protein 13C-like [Corticium candelabrum]
MLMLLELMVALKTLLCIIRYVSNGECGCLECVQILLKHGALVKSKNNTGWNCLEEAISYGDRQTIASLVQKLRYQARELIETKRPRIVKLLKQLPNFYLELKWDFHSWIPLVSRMLPSDVCKVYKKGSCLRMDTTLVDFSDMKWQRGNLSFLFNGDAQRHCAVCILDNELKVYQRMKGHLDEVDLDDEVDFLMSTDIVSIQMSTKPVSFTRSQCGWLFKTEKTEKVGLFDANVYDIHGLTVVTRKRREHLSEEDLQRNKALVESFTKGQTNGDGEPSLERRQSLLPPPHVNVGFCEYLNAENDCHFGRPMLMKEDKRNFKAAIALCDDFPVAIHMLLDLLEIIAPFRHFNKLREFVDLRLPPGFPVKAEIPVLPTITAQATFQDFVVKDDIPAHIFLIPRDYKEDPSRFPDV